MAEGDTSGYGHLSFQLLQLAGVSGGNGGLQFQTIGIDGIAGTSGSGGLGFKAVSVHGSGGTNIGSGGLQFHALSVAGSGLSSSGSGGLLFTPLSITGSSLNNSGSGGLSFGVDVGGSGTGIEGGDSNGFGSLSFQLLSIVGSELGAAHGFGGLIFPALKLSGETRTTAPVCLVVNTDNMLLSEYIGYDFLGFAKYRDDYLALGSDGNLYVLGSNTDAGAMIEATVQTGHDDLGTTKSKRMLGLTLGLKSAGELTYKAERWDEEGVEFTVPSTNLSVIETRKLPTEKTKISRTLGVEIKNELGCYFKLDSIEMQVKLTPKRSGGS